MRTVVDAALLREADASSLRFECDDCVYFDAARASCVHGYPVEEHRPGALAVGRVIVFCKEFELT
jgi:hypothetical protein